MFNNVAIVISCVNMLKCKNYNIPIIINVINTC